MITNKRVSAFLLLLAIAPHACAKPFYLNRPFDQLRNDLIVIKKYYLSKNVACNNKEQIEALQARRRLATQVIVVLIGLGLCGSAIYGWQAMHTIMLANNDQPSAAPQQEEQKIEQINHETTHQQSQPMVIVSNEQNLVPVVPQEQHDNQTGNQNNKMDQIIQNNQLEQLQQSMKEQLNQQKVQEVPAVLKRQESTTDLIPVKKEKIKILTVLLQDKSGLLKLAGKIKDKKNKDKKEQQHKN